MNIELPEDFIPIEEKINDFKTYIKTVNRAILSARFGDGKSTFLNEFEKNSADEYIIFRIYPVNYQVAENKDIFENIKRDLLMQMLSYIEFEEFDSNLSCLLYYYFQNNTSDLLDDSIDSIPDIDVGVIKTDWIKKPLMNLLKNIKKFKQFKEQSQASNESTQIENFIKAFDYYKGSIYEFDTVSQIICRLNKQIKEQEDKQIILVIEDLDRIDPAHIFRILNIMSAHIERSHCGVKELEITNGENKFLFDKILLVCDFDNIKNIFHHFYGKETDFLGYISKFSSNKPFYYSLKDGYKEFILKRLEADQDLSRFKTILSILADLIIEKEFGNGKSETVILRNLNHSLKCNYSLIRQETIQIPNDEIPRSKHKISSVNRVTKLLDISRRFSITGDELYFQLENMKDDQFIRELNAFIGCCWLLPIIENPFEIKQKNNSISVLTPVYDGDRHVFRIKFDRDENNIITDFYFEQQHFLPEHEKVINTAKLKFAKLLFNELSCFLIGIK